MSDLKYGRLYTEKDVIRLMLAARRNQKHFGHTEDEMRQLIALCEDNELPSPYTFPADEPLFLLRGQDVLALDTLDYYSEQCEIHTEPEHIRAIKKTYAAFVEWQEENPERVKTPDTRPEQINKS